MPKITLKDKYREEKHFLRLKPNKEIIEILKYKKSGKVLDLGVGEGRNSLFLAKKGFEVTGVDISQSKISKFLEHAKTQGIKVKGIVNDIRKFKINKKYDIILSTAVFHFLKINEINKLIIKIKNNTKKGGLNVISVFTQNNPSKNFPYLFKKNQLKKFYKGWNILHYKEFMTSLEMHKENEKPHRHAIAILIAQKV